MASTTEPVPGAIEPDAKVPAVPTIVPASDELPDVGVTAPVVPARPQTMRKRELLAGAVLFAAGHAVPGAAVEVETMVSSTSNANRLTPSAPADAAVAFADCPLLAALGPTRTWLSQLVAALAEVKLSPAPMVAVTENVVELPGVI